MVVPGISSDTFFGVVRENPIFVGSFPSFEILVDKRPDVSFGSDYGGNCHNSPSPEMLAQVLVQCTRCARHELFAEAPCSGKPSRRPSIEQGIENEKVTPGPSFGSAQSRP